jgi:hypothetical protein
MHLLFCGMKHSADTEPIAGEIFSDKDLGLHLLRFNNTNLKFNF